MAITSVVSGGASASGSKTILKVVQEACLVLGLDEPGTLYSSTDRTAQELVSAVTETGRQLLDACEWRALTRLCQFTGDGASTAVDMPSDYDRMTKDGRVWSSRTLYPLIAIEDDDDWLRLQVRQYEIVIGSWIILGGQMQFKPALYTSEVASFYYISNAIAQSSGGTGQSDFLADTDLCVLDDRLLKLGIVWNYRQRKGLPYAEHMATFGEALEKAIMKDKGARIIGQRSKLSPHAKLAYPGTITP